MRRGGVGRHLGRRGVLGHGALRHVPQQDGADHQHAASEDQGQARIALAAHADRGAQFAAVVGHVVLEAQHGRVAVQTQQLGVGFGHSRW
jgi:hypothetical protein